MTYSVGDRVRARVAVYEEACDHAPGGYFCRVGDELIVRELESGLVSEFVCSVAHEGVVDVSFWVKADEIEASA